MVPKKGVILTKDNFVRRNYGSKMCAFCSKDETIEHLFFDCLYAKFLRRVVHFVLGLKPPKDAHDLFYGCTNKGEFQINPCC